MKRIISIALIFVLALTLCSCGKPEKTSDAMYQIGLNALTMTDEYIEGKITGTEAKERIDEFYSQSKALIEQERKDAGSDYLFGTDYSNDESIESQLSLLSLAISGANDGIRTMSDIRKYRDALAEDIGKKSPDKKEQQNTTTADLYSYEQEKEIQSFLESKVSAYNVTVFVDEAANGLQTSFSLKRVELGAEYMFADLLELTTNAVSEAKTQFDFELSKFTLSFILYKNNFTEEASSTITFDTEDLQSGLFVDSLKDIVKTNITVDEAIELLR